MFEHLQEFICAITYMPKRIPPGRRNARRIRGPGIQERRTHNDVRTGAILLDHVDKKTGYFRPSIFCCKEISGNKTTGREKLVPDGAFRSENIFGKKRLPRRHLLYHSGSVVFQGVVDDRLD